MNMRKVRTYPHPENARHTVHVYDMGERGAGAELHVAVQPDIPHASQGAGGVHHVAFRTPDADYDAWADRLEELRVPNSGKVDRFWFRSLYFREPNGILFEIATRRPGLRRRRADGQARREAGAAALPRRAPQGDRGGAEAAVALPFSSPACGRGWQTVEDGAPREG